MSDVIEASGAPVARPSIISGDLDLGFLSESESDSESDESKMIGLALRAVAVKLKRGRISDDQNISP